MTGDKREADNTDLTSTKKLKLSTDQNEGKIQRTYEDLVALTKENPEFRKFFGQKPGAISTTTMKKSSKAKYRKVVALDCEMCKIENAETKRRDNNAMVRVTMVDGEDPDEVLVDLIVHQPSEGYNVLEYKTEVHGIAEDVIKESNVSKERARKELLKYIGPDTILVGHCLYYDLKACGIHHENVIDTSYVFSRINTGKKARSPLLGELTQQILNIQLPEIHDTSIDAKMVMVIAKYGLTNPIGEVIQSKYDKNYVETPAKEELFVRHLSKGITRNDLHDYIVENCHIVPKFICKIANDENKQFGFSKLSFQSKEHAQVAFEFIPGDRGIDDTQCPTNQVSITTKDGVVHEDIVFVASK